MGITRRLDHRWSGSRIERTESHRRRRSQCRRQLCRPLVLVTVTRSDLRRAIARRRSLGLEGWVALRYPGFWAIVLAAVVSLMACSCNQIGHDDSSPLISAASATKKPAPRRLAAFSGLSGPIEMAPLVRDAARYTLGDSAPPGMRYTSAVRGKARGRDLWVVEGSTSTCLFFGRQLAAACTNSRRAVDSGLWLQLVSGSLPWAKSEIQRRFLLVGIAPDGIERVWVERRGGFRRPLLVQRNVFMAVSATPIRVLGFAAPSRAGPA